MKLSVIIVSYNVQYFLEQCLKSVLIAGKGIKMEIFVVDNNSVDDSVSMVRQKFPMVKLIENKTNAGFSKANNQAIVKASGQYILLLNPDTIVEDDTLTKVIEFMDSTPDAGGLGVKMLDGKGRFLPESKRALPTPSVAFYKIFGLSALFPKSKRYGKYHLGYLEQNKIHQVEVLSGAFMLLRKETLDKTGLLDETFFMYGEDIDLSCRIIKAGYKNYYFPHTRIIHYKGESTKKFSINYVIVFYNAMIIFARKHFSRSNARILSFLINLAIYFRASLALLRRCMKNTILPLIDISIIYLGFLLIKSYWETHVLGFGPDYYPDEFATYFIPAYIAIWLFGVYISAGYDKPGKLFNIVKGIGIGTVIILVIFALLPISMRFSRALILIGAFWALIAMLTTRLIWRLIAFGNIRSADNQSKRIIIVGTGDEPQRVASMLKQSGCTAFIGLVTTQDTKPEHAGYLGTLTQLKEILDIYKINELIFCASQMSSQMIISHMSGLNNKPLSFKIAPPESLYLIGSNSIDTFGDIFTIDINTINHPVNKRYKRLFDLLTAFAVTLSFPLLAFIVNKPLFLLRNIFLVIFNQKTWIGYNTEVDTNKLPVLKRGVLNPTDGLKNRQPDTCVVENLNALYAKDYKLQNDLKILIAGVQNLDRK